MPTLEIWEPQPPGNLRAYPGLYRDCFISTMMLGSLTESQIYNTVHTATLMFVDLSTLTESLSSFSHIISSQHDHPHVAL